MKRASLKHYRPFFSVLIIISHLLAVVFLKMELRRMGYLSITHLREYKELSEELRKKNQLLADLLGPQNLRRYAMDHLTLHEVRRGQVIHLSEDGLAVPQ